MLWPRVRTFAIRFIDRTLGVAADLRDRELAAALPGPLPLAALTARAAKRWRALLDRYGLDWSGA